METPDKATEQSPGATKTNTTSLRAERIPNRVRGHAPVNTQVSANERRSNFLLLLRHWSNYTIVGEVCGKRLPKKYTLGEPSFWLEPPLTNGKMAIINGSAGWLLWRGCSARDSLVTTSVHARLCKPCQDLLIKAIFVQQH